LVLLVLAGPVAAWQALADEAALQLAHHHHTNHVHRLTNSNLAFCP